MTAGSPALTSRPAWIALAAHHAKLRDVHLRDLFAADPSRGERMTAEGAGSIVSGEWWLPVFPGLAISITVVGFNLLGDAVRDLFDPRSEARTLVA